MARPVQCSQCGKRFLVPEAFKGRVRCPHCGQAPGDAPKAAARAQAPQEVPRRAPAERPVRAAAEASGPAPVAATGRRAWEQAAARRRQPRQWPPPRDERSRAFADALRKRLVHSKQGLWPYLLLMVVLILALFLFALLAGRAGRREVGPESARRPVTQEVPFLA